ncbi:MAG: NAD(P)H-hydrate dehydratase [Proteobacteria bacterium]|nr:NAD(P)H-hydrate dehydratase [Pseudomonadota bacterium]
MRVPCGRSGRAGSSLRETGVIGIADELLSVEEMGRADAAAIAGGVAGERLMEAAGCAVASAAHRRFAPRPAVVLAGPGNNGGDGFVVARSLAEWGWPVRVALLGDRAALKGDAARAASGWSGPCEPLAGPEVLEGARLVIDALFGAGLARPIEGPARAAIEAINARRLDCVAVDVPSGVHGDSGEVLGAAPRCRLTVTFFRRKPGHLLYPGREFAGEVMVADIGIPAAVLGDVRPTARVNTPAAWRVPFPRPGWEDHKYSRGHALIAGGLRLTGAARLAARAARRVGAGLVTIASPAEAMPVYQGDWPGVLVAPVDGRIAFTTLLTDARMNAVLIGPGNGISDWTRARVETALGAGRACVLDADALSSFKDHPQALFAAIHGPCVMTPHDGEFARLFNETGDRLRRARAAARIAGAVVLLKGPDTVVAAADGRALIAANAPFDLATAGTGDVLAGLIVGLIAQRMEPFAATGAACWLHGEAAREVGSGLIAEDLIDALPVVLHRLLGG